MKTKNDLIEMVVEQIQLDVHCGDVTAIEELVKTCPIENLVAYLPDDEWKKYSHLITEEYLKREEDDRTS